MVYNIANIYPLCYYLYYLYDLPSMTNSHESVQSAPGSYWATVGAYWRKALAQLYNRNDTDPVHHFLALCITPFVFVVCLLTALPRGAKKEPSASNYIIAALGAVLGILFLAATTITSILNAEISEKEYLELTRVVKDPSLPKREEFRKAVNDYYDDSIITNNELSKLKTLSPKLAFEASLTPER